MSVACAVFVSDSVACAWRCCPWRCGAIPCGWCCFLCRPTPRCLSAECNRPVLRASAAVAISPIEFCLPPCAALFQMSGHSPMFRHADHAQTRVYKPCTRRSTAATRAGMHQTLRHTQLGPSHAATRATNPLPCAPLRRILPPLCTTLHTQPLHQQQLRGEGQLACTHCSRGEGCCSLDATHAAATCRPQDRGPPSAKGKGWPLAHRSSQANAAGAIESTAKQESTQSWGTRGRPRAPQRCQGVRASPRTGQRSAGGRHSSELHERTSDSNSKAT